MRWLIGAALCFGVLAAGCGGGARLSTDDYRTQIDRLAQEAREAQEEVNVKAPKAKTVADVRAIVGELAAEEEHVAERVAGLHPPKPAEQPNTELAQARSEFARAIRTTLPKIDAAPSVPAAATVLRASEPIRAAATRVANAMATLVKLGYATNKEEEK